MSCSYCQDDWACRCSHEQREVEPTPVDPERERREAVRVRALYDEALCGEKVTAAIKLKRRGLE